MLEIEPAFAFSGGALEAEIGAALAARGWQTDYLTVRRRMDLLPPTDGQPVAGHSVLLAAARVGQTRLIDSLEL